MDVVIRMCDAASCIVTVVFMLDVGGVGDFDVGVVVAFFFLLIINNGSYGFFGIISY